MEKRRELMRRDAVNELIARCAAQCSRIYRALAARCSRDFMVGRNIDAVVHQIRREMAAACLAKADGAADGLIADRQQGTPKATTEMLADQDRGVQRKLMRREGVDAFISRATTRVQIRRYRGRR